MRRDVIPHGGVVVGELLLGDLDIGPIDAVRVGEFDRTCHSADLGAMCVAMTLLSRISPTAPSLSLLPSASPA